MIKGLAPISIMIVNGFALCAQPVYHITEIEVRDTVNVPGIEVIDTNHTAAISRLDDVQSGAIYSAKKSELVQVRNLTLNTSTNNARQAFSSVAGLNIWESDAAGLQLGIGGRGLSPDRTSNFNTRQNGYDISADPLGYPEAYYTPPLDAIDRIEIVRGSGSLRYGTQFGGTVNFIMKNGSVTSPFSVRSKVDAGSYGYAAAFLEADGGSSGFTYFGSYQIKRQDGWRPNSEFNAHTVNASVGQCISDYVSLKADYTFMTYLSHQPGGLTDKQFAEDPSVSVRARNWFTINWNLAALQMDAIISERTSIRSILFGNFSSRQSVGDLSRINVADMGGPRTVVDGQFTNVGNETTITTSFDVGADTLDLVTGVRLYHGTTTQRQGDGTDNSDADFSFANPDHLEGSDYTFPNDDVAMFAESVIHLGNGWQLVPGVRIENITTRAQGWYRTLLKDFAGNVIVDTITHEDRTRSRPIVLGGIGLSWKANADIELYGNATQNYRSITFTDLRVSNPNLVVDPNITDERGYTLDAGVRGIVAHGISVDASAFYLRYNNRIGEITRSDEPPYYIPYTYRTNIADAYTTGVELVTNIDIIRLLDYSVPNYSINWMINASVMSGKYTASEETSIVGNNVELVPPYTIRTGIQFSLQGLKASMMSSWTGQQYSDASNAEYTATAVSGIIPAYNVFDLSLSYQHSWFFLELSCNNLLNSTYFTRRASSYPGPGIIPAEPRTLTLGVQAKI